MNEWEWRLLEERTRVDRVCGPAGTLVEGTRVRLRPRTRGDAMDILLAGRTAVIEAIEQDYEGTFHVALVFDDDPGRDFGFLRQPGHRFFYAPEELEPLTAAGVDMPPAADLPAAPAGKAEPVRAAPAILIAGVGNIFFGDDGFGVEVARRLGASALPPGVVVVDYGIRGLDLAYALMDGPGVTILVDACRRGEAPGTLFVIEPDLQSDAGSPPALDAHAMDPLAVIRMARSMGGPLNRILLVGCEPATLGPEEGQLGLSGQVEAAVDAAVTLVIDLAREIREGSAGAARGSLPTEKGDGSNECL